MKRILILLCALPLVFSATACENDGEHTEQVEQAEDVGLAEIENGAQQESNMQIQIQTQDNHIITFQLNHSPAAKALYEQLPLSIWVDDYADSEKIFYLPKEQMNTSNTPLAKGSAGILAYYAPWGNIAIFHEECSGADGLYELGEAISGVEYIAGMTGEILIEPVGELEPQPEIDKEAAEMELNIQVGDHLLTASLAQNSSVDALVEMLSEGPVTIKMNDYANMEKVGAFPKSLPRNDKQINTDAGDLILYQGNSFVIYYDANSWNFTRLGKINDVSKQELKNILGEGSVDVTLSL